MRATLDLQDIPELGKIYFDMKGILFRGLQLSWFTRPALFFFRIALKDLWTGCAFLVITKYHSVLALKRDQSIISRLGIPSTFR